MTNKKVVFVSNYFSHHQEPFSREMYKLLGENYTFIETTEMEEERKNMGWSLDDIPPYVVTSEIFYEQNDKYSELLNLADVVIVGSAPYELIKKRIKANKLVFRYSERPLKKGLEIQKYLYRFIRWHKNYPNSKNAYLLCASAYTAGDYAKFALFKNKCYKWGYFPETINYDDVSCLIDNKEKNSLIWVARYIDWKHPEMAIKVAKRLRDDGYEFKIKMIGNGILFNDIKESINKNALNEHFELLGTMSPQEVRKHMELSEIHIFTSDRREGWGAVLNESMNSACVPIANIDIGSVPFLIKNTENGFTYKVEDELYERVKFLLDNPQIRKKMAVGAYRTILDEWNAETAAKRFLALVEEIQMHEKCEIFHSGPCSKSI